MGQRSHLSTDKDVNRVLRAAYRRGWTWSRGRKHLALAWPAGGRVTVPISPSDHRTVANLAAELRRAEKRAPRAAPG